MLAARRNRSAAMWEEEPIPADAKVKVPGFALASATTIVLGRTTRLSLGKSIPIEDRTALSPAATLSRGYAIARVDEVLIQLGLLDPGALRRQLEAAGRPQVAQELEDLPTALRRHHRAPVLGR